MRKTLISLFILNGLISCEKYNNFLQTNSGLIGTWEWIRTDGGFAFHIHESPFTTGTTYLLKLTAESKIFINENGINIFTGNYMIEKEKSIYTGEIEDYILITENYDIQSIVISGIVKVDNDSLTIDDNCYDGIGSSYIRIE
jgi:hypothetical protein